MWIQEFLFSQQKRNRPISQCIRMTDSASPLDSFGNLLPHSLHTGRKLGFDNQVYAGKCFCISHVQPDFCLFVFFPIAVMDPIPIKRYKESRETRLACGEGEKEGFPSE